MASQEDNNAKRVVISREAAVKTMAGSLQVEGDRLAILSCQANLVTLLTFHNLLHGLFSLEGAEHGYFGEGSRGLVLLSTDSPFKMSGTLLLQQALEKVIVERKRVEKKK